MTHHAPTLPTQRLAGVDFPDYSALRMEDWERLMREAMAAAQATWDAGLADERVTWDTTFGALEQGQAQFLAVAGPFSLLVDGGDEQATALHEELSPLQAEARVRQLANPQFAQRCRDAFDKEFKQWPAYQVRAAQQWLLAMCQTGALLPSDSDRDRLAALAGQMAALEARFFNLNGQACDAVLWFDAQDLAGVDPDRLETGDDGRLGVRMIREPVDAVLADCVVRSTRQTVFQAFERRGSNQDVNGIHTSEVIAELLTLRDEKAKLLGFANFAEMSLSTSMARTPDSANGLLLRTWNSVAPAMVETLDQLEARAIADGLDRLAPWDTFFYLTAAERENKGQATTKTTLGTARTAAFALAKRLFNLDFIPTQAPTPWSNMESWRVERDGVAIGGMLTDFGARASKPSGAWMHLLTAGHVQYGNTLPVVANTCNYGVDGDATLLSGADVQTLFHEFGHALHGLLGRTQLPSQCGTNTLQDWVELPSQLLENWAMDPQCAAELGLPAGSAGERGGAAEQATKARYLQSAVLDMTLHSQGLGGKTLEAFEQSVLEDMGADPRLSPWHSLSHFSHLFSSEAYAAGYYGYLWAEALDADVFQWAQQAGPMDRSTGQALEEAIYARGDEVEPQKLFSTLVGRLPTPDALLGRLGVANDAVTLEPKVSRAPRP
jgi:peptidyl-dipeptidase Dcp